MQHQLKICGMLQPGNIAAVADLQPDYLGFIFYKGSKRYAGGVSPEVLSTLPSAIKKVGVFVNEELEILLDVVARYSLDAVQLHGAEGPDYCRLLVSKLQGREIKLIKAFGVNEYFDFKTIEAYKGIADYFLFDTQTPDHGGSGKKFNWQLLEKYTLDVAYFLSGGIGLESADAVRNIQDPRLLAIDVNSKFEVEPGLKDVDQLIAFKNSLSI